MPQCSIHIVDVGHGNSAVIVCPKGVIVLDTGLGSGLADFLEQEHIEKVNKVLISHADQDHIEGLILLLSSKKVEIEYVCFNTDSLMGSDTWEDLTWELQGYAKRGVLEFDVGLTINDSGKHNLGDLGVEILSPSQYLMSRGPGQTERLGERILTSNSVSVVFRLLWKGEPAALFPGDIDNISLDHIADGEGDLETPIVVFPHHGGMPGKGSAEEFAKKFCDIFSPRTVIFSIGRGRHGTPRPEIVRTIKEAIKDIRIICTQLSKHCAAELPESSPDHLSEKFACGKSKNKCCGGTISISLDKDALMIQPELESHSQFIAINAPTSLCGIRMTT